jgi:hypothetical protein
MNLDQRNSGKKLKGSVTIEACVILPIFLSFFLILLTLVKIACINIALDHAVNETAKQIATCAYPVSFLNELEDKIVEKYGAGKIDSLQENIKEITYNSLEESSQDVTTDMLSGNFSMTDISNILTSVKQNGSEVLKKGLGSLVENLGEDSYWNIKEIGKYAIVKSVMDQLLDVKLINKNNLKLTLVEFPQGDTEYEACKKSTAIKAIGLIPDKDFGIDDVVIQIQYKLKISLPVLGARTINLKHTAIERGWLHGGNGVYTSKAEGIKLEDFGKVQKIVYITRTGEKYHTENCRYLRHSKIAVTLNDEIKSSYEPCKVCKP